MYIAEKLRRQNVTAYLIYMYQVEDVIRAYQMNAERIREDYLVRFGYDEDQMAKAYEWYAALIQMMKDEGCQEHGHVQVVRATLTLLEDRHQEPLMNMLLMRNYIIKLCPCWWNSDQGVARRRLRWRTAWMPSTD